MKKSLWTLLFLILLVSCTNKKKDKNGSSDKSLSNISEEYLLNTQWEYELVPGCVCYYKFLDGGKSIYYSCESEDKYYGNFFVEYDTIYIHNYITDRDSLLSDIESSHRSQEAKYKLTVENNLLKHHERWFYSKGSEIWKKDSFVFEKDFLFHKVQ